MPGLDETIAQGAKMAEEAQARSRAVRGAAAAMARSFAQAAPAIEAARVSALRAGDLVPETRAGGSFAQAAAAAREFSQAGDLDSLIEATSYAESAADALLSGVRAVEADPVLEEAAEAAEAMAAAIRAYLREVADLRRLEGPASQLGPGLAG